MTAEPLVPVGPDEPDGLCRFCKGKAWGSDDERPVHPCCRWWETKNPGRLCLACLASKKLARDRERFVQQAIERGSAANKSNWRKS